MLITLTFLTRASISGSFIKVKYQIYLVNPQKILSYPNYVTKSRLKDSSRTNDMENVCPFLIQQFFLLSTSSAIHRFTLIRVKEMQICKLARSLYYSLINLHCTFNSILILIRSINTCQVQLCVLFIRTTGVYCCDFICFKFCSFWDIDSKWLVSGNAWNFYDLLLLNSFKNACVIWLINCVPTLLSTVQEKMIFIVTILKLLETADRYNREQVRRRTNDFMYILLTPCYC